MALAGEMSPVKRIAKMVKRAIFFILYSWHHALRNEAPAEKY
jgi:hypothetical protein